MQAIYIECTKTLLVESYVLGSDGEKRWFKMEPVTLNQAEMAITTHFHQHNLKRIMESETF